MSSRVLRDDLWTSESIDQLHDKTFRLYVCVINAADDYGLVETGFGHLCRAAPLRRWNAEEMLKMLAEMYDGHVLLPYRVHEKTYCAVDKWQCFMRSVKPRCPIPSFGLAHIRMPYGFKNERVRHAASLLLKHLDIKGTTPGPPQGIPGDDLGHVGSRELGIGNREEGSSTPLATTSTKAKSHGSRFALTAPPDDWRNWTSEHFPGASADRTFASFRDYWIAQPGQRGVRLDWFATWRNWLRRDNPNRGLDADAALIASMENDPRFKGKP